MRVLERRNQIRRSVGRAVDLDSILADLQLLEPSAVREQLRQLLEQPKFLPVARAEVREDRRADLEGTRLLILSANLLSRDFQESNRALQRTAVQRPFDPGVRRQSNRQERRRGAQSVNWGARAALRLPTLSRREEVDEW